MTDDPGDLLGRAVGGIVRRGSQLGRKQVPTAEDVQRQIAVAVVIAVEVPPLLLAVEPIIGCVEINDDACRRLGMRIQEQITEQAFNGSCVMIELVVTVLADLAGVLQPVERGLAASAPPGLSMTAVSTGSKFSASWSMRSS